ALDLRGPVDRRQRHQHLHGRAIGIGDDAAFGVLRDRVRVDLAHHQRHIVYVTEFGSVVDHHRTGRSRARRVLAADLAARGEERDVDARETVIGEIFHRQRFAIELDHAAGRAFARQRNQFSCRKFALGQDRKQGFADRTGGADNRDVVTGFLAHYRNRRSGKQALANYRWSLPVILGNTSPTSSHCARWRSAWSINTNATIASAIGTARMPTQGSCRPLLRICTSSPARFTLWPGFRMLDVGFSAIEASTSCPLEIPPSMPPA